MNYIGSKRTLLPFLQSSIRSIISEPLEELVFCDLFAGTGIVASTFKPLVKQVIANDFEYYSYVLIRNYIGNHQPVPRRNELIKELNQLPPKKGFIYEHYCAGGKSNRNYFTNTNGQKIDAIRAAIENWKTKNRISDNTYFFLLASLLESADKVANTASVYGAYLKHIKQSAQHELKLLPAEFPLTPQQHAVYQKDANELISSVSGDILYLDPPYNQRQYGANYHLLNTIAQYTAFKPKGITGLPDYQKSAYCKKNEVLSTFRDLIARADFKYIFLSYNNEGLMSVKDVQSILEEHGQYQLFTQKGYQRFKADKDSDRSHKASTTDEYLHVLRKS